MAKPMPPLAPVTTAALSSDRFVMSSALPASIRAGLGCRSVVLGKGGDLQVFATSFWKSVLGMTFSQASKSLLRSASLVRIWSSDEPFLRFSESVAVHREDLRRILSGCWS